MRNLSYFCLCEYDRAYLSMIIRLEYFVILYSDFVIPGKKRAPASIIFKIIVISMIIICNFEI